MVHEIGHTFHPKNSQWKEWKEISSWTDDYKDYTTDTTGFGSYPSTIPGWHKGDGMWHYWGTPGFITDYADDNPYDDFAETFAAALLHATGHKGDWSIVNAYDSIAMTEKHDFMEDWLDTKRS